MEVMHIACGWKILTAQDLQHLASNQPPCLYMGEKTEVSRTYWNCTQLGFVAYSKSVTRRGAEHRFLEVQVTAWFTASPPIWCECKRAPAVIMQCCSEGILGVCTTRHMNSALLLLDQAACPQVLSVALCTYCLNQDLFRDLWLAFPLLGGDMPWARAFFGFEFFPFLSSKIATMSVSCCSMGLPFVKKTHQPC